MYQPYLLIALLILAMILFIVEYWRYDVVGLLILIIAVFVGIVPFNQAFAGFSNPAVVTVACVMILTKAVSQSGLLDYLIRKIEFLFKNTFIHVGTLTVITAVLSSFMNNVGALALMMPIAIQTFIKNGKSPSLVLMPIAFGSVFGGVTTLIGTPPNILISYYREKITGDYFNMFDYTPVGILIALAGILFIIFFGWRLIPVRRSAAKAEDLFQISDYMIEVKVPEDSPFVGKTVEEMQKKIEAEFELIAITRNGKKQFSFPNKKYIHIDDVLIFEAPHESLEKVVKAGKFKLVGDKPISSAELSSKEIAIMEAVVPPDSDAIGRSAKMMKLRSRYALNLLALSRKGISFRQNLNDIRFASGDVVLLQGNVETLQETIVSLGFLPLVERGIDVEVTRKRILPIAIFFIAIVLVTLQVLPIEIAFTAAVLVLILANLMSPRMMYQSIDWPVLLFLATFIPVGEALQSTGAAKIITDGFMSISGQYSPIFALTAILIVTMLLSDFMNNVATVLVMAPIAVRIAESSHANVDTFLMAVAIGASCSFLTPIAYHNYTMVMGPGGYKFFDYPRLGLPLELITVCVAVPALLWIWPL
ncbi:SLC13 family permease [Aquicella lusitana]|uniref:Di/tricarboxylate transporter n=1 Tax=Aquicella lusitana TaxID=254246 RepID=A0A370GFT3_9COXI|nr:SLC13 family permease [Aquicella lusitana]RDI42066.1 di/tricarboxylate transporter [Aquicella lusitana]VVC74427.1 hypothetical protein AQULUS_21930 [Aquicella lusitana]